MYGRNTCAHGQQKALFGVDRVIGFFVPALLVSQLKTIFISYSA